VQIMTDVACFCGCCYSFDGGAGACPQCGEYAVISAEPALPDTGRNHQQQAGQGSQEREDAETAAASEDYREWSAAGRPGAISHEQARRLLLGEHA
jgi:hypothetical protein